MHAVQGMCSGALAPAGWLQPAIVFDKCIVIEPVFLPEEADAAAVS